MTHPSMKERMARGDLPFAECKQAEKLCDLIAIGHDGGREAERAAIVAWLRGPCVPDHSDEGGCPFDKAARMIERGQHLTTKQEG